LLLQHLYLVHHIKAYISRKKDRKETIIVLQQQKWNDHLDVAYKASVLIQTKFGIEINVFTMYPFVNASAAAVAIVITNGGLSILIQHHQSGRKQKLEQLNQN
jgi:hypothetical protein